MAQAGLAGRRSDVFGLTLLAVAVLSSLALVGDAAGPVGEALSDGFGAVVGIFRFLVPVVLLWWGYVLLRGSRKESNWRMGFGIVVLCVVIPGLVHLARGPRAIDVPLDQLRDAGGVAGAVVAEPLRALVAGPGAWVVLSTVAVFGLLVVLNLSLRQVLDAFVRVGQALRHVIERLRDARPGDSVVEQPGLGPAVGEDATIDLGGGPSFVDAAVDSEAESGDENAVDELPFEDLGELEPLVSVPDVELAAPAEVAGSTKGPWKYPPAKLLELSGRQEVDERLLHAGARALEAALGSHGVETRVTGMEVGPTVTRYELQLGRGVKVSRVTSLHKDIAYAMASADVRILAPIPGRSAIGVEVPNSDRHLVALGDILASKVATESEHPLEVALGQDISGRAVMANLATMPHVLIAGATGAGKSSCINSIISSLLMRTTPDQVRLILIDPKRVELGQYDRLPHLLTQVVTNPKKAANALAWAVKEMERRYDVLSEVGFRDITGYNNAVDDGALEAEAMSGPLVEGREFERMPFIVVVVDELNDLMMVAARDVEESITRLAQMARAVGIHLVVATQRPSVNVITGVIKANIPSRMAFAVSSLADSRVILDQPGAERLVGKGDMLLSTANSSVATRIQGCWVSESEVHAIVGHWRRQAPDTTYVEGVEGDEEVSATLPGGTTGDQGDDELLIQAMRLVVESQLGSTSMLQRKLKVGFARAGRLMDLLEQRGVVGPSHGSKARDVLMTPEELVALMANSGGS